MVIVGKDITVLTIPEETINSKRLSELKVGELFILKQPNSTPEIHVVTQKPNLNDNTVSLHHQPVFFVGDSI